MENLNSKFILILFQFFIHCVLSIAEKEVDICHINDVSCITENKIISLPPIHEGWSESEDTSQMFFIESSGRDHLLPRQACAIGKTHALKKYDQFAQNTSCFYPSCAISRNFCYKNNE